MVIQYNIVVTIVNLIDNSTSRFNKTFDTEITATDALLYNNYHILSKDMYILDMFKDEVDAYCKALSIEKSSVEIDEFEIVSLTERTDVFFESEEDNSLSLKPTIKCYVYPKNDALKIPNLVGVAYDSTTIIWSWPEDEQYAHYLIEESIDFSNESDKSKIIAQLPIGATSYTETGLKPDTPYTRRLVNYTDEQTSVPSPSVTVTTETVEIAQSLEEYTVTKNYDFTTDDTEKDIIEENLPAFHSGVGDSNDLKVYKQMNGDFYQKFKTYFELTGKRTQREKRYEQVGFNYKICLEAEETIEEQEGEVTFDLTAYPREEITVEQYMYGTMPVNVYSKLNATIFLRKEVQEIKQVEVKTLEEIWEQGEDVERFYGNPLNIVFVLDCTRSLYGLPFGDGGPVMKSAVCSCIDAIESYRGDVDVSYCIIKFGHFAKQVTNFVDASEAKKAVNDLAIDEFETNWAHALDCAKKAIDNSGKDGKFVTYFFSDGFPNHRHNGINDCYTPTPSDGRGYISGAGGYWIESALLEDLTVYANALKGVCEKVACLISNYGGGDYVDKTAVPDMGYHAEYIRDCQAAVATEGGKLIWNDAAGMKRVFKDYIKEFSEVIPGQLEFRGYKEKTEVINVPYTFDDVKAVNIETETLSFEFNENITPVYYSQKEQRAVMDKEGFIKPKTTKMSQTSVYDLILNAAQKTPEWAAGYNKTVGTTNGDYLINGLTIKDSYGFSDEDTMNNNTLEHGMVGSVNVYTDIDNAGTTSFGDDCYLVSRNNYVYIDGYTDAIIYDGTRFITSELNAYNHPSEILISSQMDYKNYLSNRKNPNIGYSGDKSNITAVIRILEKGDDIWLEGYNALAKEGDVITIEGIKNDLVAHNDTIYKSPILNYRFNLEDPDAKTSYYEILPDCNPNSNYLHIATLHIYYARNVFVTNEDNYIESFGDSPVATTSSDFIEFKWTDMQWKDGKDNGKYIDDYLWFMGKPTIKQQNYYDELPGPGVDTFYGLVNGRYASSNQDGKKDLVIDTPKFNIPTTVNLDTVKIYIMITESYPSSSLVSYKWENPFNNINGITQVNGDYVTFSSSNLTYKDVEYKDIVSTVNMENQEIFDNKTTEMIFEISKPDTIYDYSNYYLEVSTDNSDVLPLRYPTEISFDENGLASINVAFKGVVNATSQWAPRIHNGYYYLNQHEYFAYSEFNVQANFDTYEETNYKTINGYISFDVQLRHKAKPQEEYSITKSTRSELLQNEKEFQWINDKGLTLKPYINGVYYREYLTYMYYSPVILFDNALTEAGILNVDYYFEDGSEYLPMEVRSYDTQEGKWSEWTSFENNNIPDVPLSTAYQLRFNLQASVQNSEMSLEDYMCCYLDWKEDINESNTTNIVTVTDYMTTGPDEGDGVYVSNIIDYGCKTELMLDIFESNYKDKIKIYLGYSSKNPDTLLLENIKWHNITNAKDKPFKARYFRYKIVIPEGEKLYWLHKRVNTLETHELLPYITGISMSGSYKPEDVVTNFINTESFEIPKDGNYHTVFERVIDVIGSDVLQKGYTEEEIEYVKIQCTTSDIEIQYDNNIDNQYPLEFLNIPIEAKSDIDVDIVIKNTPYIFVEQDENDNNVIKIIGTPEQYCPITVEDTEGNSYTQLHNTDSLVQIEEFLLTEETKYLELKTNRYDNNLTVYLDGKRLGSEESEYEVYVNNQRLDIEKDEFQIYINDEKLDISNFKVYIDGDELDSSFYKVINHLIIFNDPIGVGHTVRIEYNIIRSFIAIVDRPNNTTTIYLHSGKGIPIPEKCKVFFETNTRNNKFIAEDLSLNPIYRTDYKGFIYLTDEHTEPYELKIYCNPLRLKAGGFDKVDIIIEVLDIKGNPVVSKDVAVDCEYGILNCEDYKTDINGVIHLVYESAYLKCTDNITAKVLTEDDTIIEQSITIINE